MANKIKVWDEGTEEYIYLTKKEYLEAFDDPYIHEGMSNREYQIVDTF